MKLFVISSYPQKGEIHGPYTVGVASYTKNTLLALLQTAKLKNFNLNITVFAEILNNTPQNSYLDQEVLVKRIWKRNNFASLLTLIKELLTLEPHSEILIEFEFALFGFPWTSIYLPILLGIAKLKKHKITVVLHQVVRNISELSQHIGIEDNNWKMPILNSAVKMYYQIVGSLADKIIVFEDVFRLYLSLLINPRKILVIPIGFEGLRSDLNQDTAKTNLGIHKNEIVLLAFGYIAWYKGTDWISDLIRKYTGEPILRLIIAGGPNPNRVNAPFYKKYLQSVETLANNSHGKIIITGYVPEDNISTYFVASDFVIFPYRTLMSSSGPLSMAASLGKPILISKNMQEMFETYDLRKILELSKIQVSDFTFSMENNQLINLIEKIMSNSHYKQKLELFSKEIAIVRNFANVGEMYYRMLFEKLPS